MTSTSPDSQALAPAELLAQLEPFAALSADQRAAIEPLLQPCRYRIGQTVLRPDVMPEGLLLVAGGSLRNLAPEAEGSGVRTIAQLQAPVLAGWAGLLRREPCEELRAISEVQAWLLPAAAFRDLLQGQPAMGEWFATASCPGEVDLLLRQLATRNPQWLPLLQQGAGSIETLAVRSQPPGPPQAMQLPQGFCWFISSGGPLGEAWSGRPLTERNSQEAWLRLIGLPDPMAEQGPPSSDATAMDAAVLQPLGEPQPFPLEPGSYSASPDPAAPRSPGRGGALSLRRASGSKGIPLAICQALADYFGVPVNRDALLDQIEALLQRQPQLNLVNLGQLLDSIGLRVMLTKLPADRLMRAPTPALLMQNGHIGLLDGVDPDGQARLLEAELGPLRVPCHELATAEGGLVELLLLERKQDAKEQSFNWSWFLPLLKPHRRALIEVVITSAAINVLMLATPLGFRLLLDTARQSNSGTLVSIAAGMLAAALAVGLLRTLRSYIFIEAANRIDQEGKSRILDQLVRLPQGFFDSRPVGQITFYFQQLDRLRDFLVGQSLPLLIDTTFSFLYILLLLSISPLLTLVMLSTLPLIVALTVLSNPIVYGQIRRTMRANMQTNAFLTESLTGIETIKAQNAELKTRWTFQNLYSRYLGEDFKLRISKETLSNLGQFIQQFNGVLVIAVGIWLIQQGKITIGDLIAFRILDGYILGPLVKLSSTWQQFQLTRQQMQMVADVVDRAPEQSQEESQNIPMPPLNGGLQFAGVNFRFGSDGPLVLQNINLEIPAGSFVGLVGSSGSGKSTLLKLVPRFYRPLEGTVLIDGLDINKIELYSLRRQIGVVPQNSLLFDGTIRDNLLLVKPDASADELIRAATIACAHDFIMAMPKGYNSNVGERGAGLSGGQRQRLALARVVLQNPRMLILDEATSALDARTERQVCINLLEAFRGRTVLFITHRLSTVKPADFIVLMDRGAVMEVGSHRELMAQQGWYYAQYQSQSQEGVT